MFVIRIDCRWQIARDDYEEFRFYFKRIKNDSEIDLYSQDFSSWEWIETTEDKEDACRFSSEDEAEQMITELREIICGIRCEVEDL